MSDANIIGINYLTTVFSLLHFLLTTKLYLARMGDERGYVVALFDAYSQ